MEADRQVRVRGSAEAVKRAREMIEEVAKGRAGQPRPRGVSRAKGREQGLVNRGGRERWVWRRAVKERGEGGGRGGRGRRRERRGGRGCGGGAETLTCAGGWRARKS
eukprot:1481192-Rhodomonas_salina.1